MIVLLPANDRPHDKHLNKYVRGKVCAAGTDKWRDLGIVLMGQDDVYVLDIIKANSNDNVTCCSRMFTEWRQRTPTASWKQLIEALKEVKLTQLASELEELLIPSVKCSVEQESKISQQLQMRQLPPTGITQILLICNCMLNKNTLGVKKCKANQKQLLFFHEKSFSNPTTKVFLLECFAIYSMCNLLPN